jgi:PII-like signaling protein
MTACVAAREGRETDDLLRIGRPGGRRPAFRAAVAALRRSGASGAIDLAGVDGVLSGRRRHARLFRIRGAPMVIISVGPVGPLRQSLPQLAELLPWPVVTLEGIAQPKHDVELHEPPRSTATTSAESQATDRHAPSTSTGRSWWRGSGR